MRTGGYERRWCSSNLGGTAASVALLVTVSLLLAVPWLLGAGVVLAWVGF